MAEVAEVRLNFASCCRLCLAEKPENVVFEEGTDDTGLQQKISALVAVQISSDDKLSTMVCNKCVKKLTDWQTFKQACTENQSKLEQLMQTADLSNMNIQIKEEPIEHELDPDVTIPEVVMNGSVKNEPIDVDYEEQPPTLMPYTSDKDVEVILNKEKSVNPRQCTICKKMFSLISNRKRHERTIHGKGLEIDTSNLNGNSEINPPVLTDDESKKIQFAAGLKLLQRNSVPHISLENLSKIELSYIEKCKAMSIMYKSLVCACHNVSHPNLKGLLSHLRSLRIWFPVFTCYHCMITFCDRSSSTRHHMRCNRNDLETLIKLSNLRKRSEVKTRLYQNYKCMKCKFMFSFHEDYCKHVDEEHCVVQLPQTCDCGRVFNTLETYKDHIYISCLVNFYCDICFVTVKSLSEFQRHAVEVHDHSEGFVLLQDDNYRQRRSTQVKRESLDDSAIVSGKRRISYKSSSYDDKVLNPLSPNTPKIIGNTCPICLKEYSNNHNMWRHYKSHTTPDYDDSLYCCPDCGGMFSSEEWEKHKEMHKKKTCNECGKIFQFQSELDQHRSVHLNLKVYRDSKTKSYKSQMLSPNDNVMLLCELCDLMFNSKDELKEHKLNNHEQMPVLEMQSEKKKFACKLCNKHYSGYGGLWDHNRKKHPENKTPQSGEFPKQCKYCDKILNTGGSYYMHKQMHLRIQQNAQTIQKKVAMMKKLNKIEDEDDESYHTCKKCFKVFSNKYNLKNHMKCHGLSTKPKKKVWCNLCHSAFDSGAILERHKYEEHSIDKMPHLDEEESDEIDLKSFIFTCDVCVQTFTTKNALKRHKEKHLQEQMLKETKKHLVYCKYCKISFESTQSLNNHMNKEHEENKMRTKSKNKKFPCEFCNKVFVSSMALGGHLGWHRRGKLPMNKAIKLEAVKNEPVSQFKCRTCLAVLPNDTALQLHVLEKHRNVNAIILPARCTLCNLDFATQEEYDRHKKFHEKVKNFKCNVCTASFSKLENLNEHMGRFHGKQEFKCPQCDRVFDKQNSLSIHLKVHEKQSSSTKFKLFSCSICNMSFDVPKDLRQHTIEVHPF